MKKYEEVAKRYFSISTQLYNECLNYIIDVLKQHNNKIDCTHGNRSVTVVYDGGNHPEYASNAFSRVLSIYLDKEDNSVYVEIEDCYEYSVDFLTSFELYDICIFIDDEILNKDECLYNNRRI